MQELEALLSIADVNRLINDCLEESFPAIKFTGEIAQLTRAASGHLYFALKDDQAEMSAVMWRGFVQSLTFKPEVGQKVICTGKPNVYAKSGRLQLIVHNMHEAGEGALQKKFLELKATLEREGLFAQSRKREIPFLPRTIGIVTSNSGAAIHDIMVKLQERMPGVKAVLADVRVQGEGAAKEIKAGIDLLNSRADIEVIILARGGGSLQDLWAFNEELVVRAVFSSRVPIICGVGHESDTSLADLAADVRAPTPTAAAEMAVPLRADLLKKIASLEGRISDVDRVLRPHWQRVDELAIQLERKTYSLLEHASLKLAACVSKVKAIEPGRLFEKFRNQISWLQERLLGLSRAEISRAGARVEMLEKSLKKCAPGAKVSMAAQNLKYQNNMLRQAMLQSIKQKGYSLDQLAARLEGINPQLILSRGYSMVQKDGELISSSDRLKVSDELRITFKNGEVLSTVKEKLN